jgi:hypothetical protein
MMSELIEKLQHVLKVNSELMTGTGVRYTGEAIEIAQSLESQNQTLREGLEAIKSTEDNYETETETLSEIYLIAEKTLGATK